MTDRWTKKTLLLAVMLAMVLAACATLTPAQLAEVRFRYDHISDVQIGALAVQDAATLNQREVAALLLGIRQGTLMLRMNVHLRSENPLANRAAAHMTRLDWLLRIDGRETIRSTLQTAVELPPGKPQALAVAVRLNLFEYFNERNAPDLLRLALMVAGSGGRLPPGVSLELTPTFETPFGPYTFSEPVVLGEKSL